ncbi:MAG: PD-(D/E)XK nuclease family protein [Eggerthella lenta]
MIPRTAFERAETADLRKRLVRFLDREALLLPGFEPVRFEFDFGSSEPFPYAGCLLRGSVDRIDVNGAGQAVVIDYKGSLNGDYALDSASPAAQAGGAVLPHKVQTLMYAQVARKVLGLDVVGALYVSYGRDRRVSGAFDRTVVASETCPASTSSAAACRKRARRWRLVVRRAGGRGGGSHRPGREHAGRRLHRSIRAEETRAGIAPCSPAKGWAHDLSTCTPGQRQSIEHVSGALLVSAGAAQADVHAHAAHRLCASAGSGARPASTRCWPSRSPRRPPPRSRRVKRTLRAEGWPEALRVDGAWISTIHGMCAHPARPRARPGAGSCVRHHGRCGASRSRGRRHRRRAGRRQRHHRARLVRGAVRQYPARSTMPLAPSVASMLQALMDKAAGLRGGLDALDFEASPAQASTLARELLLAYEGVLPTLERAGKSASAERARAAAADGGGARGVLADASAATACAGSCGRRLRLLLPSRSAPM